MFVFFVFFAFAAFYISEGLSTLPPVTYDAFQEPNYEIDFSKILSSFASACAKSSSPSSSSAFASASSSSSSSNLPSDESSTYDRCTPTCSIPNPSNCPETLTTTNDGCRCNSGYILSEKGGQCVKLEECQKYLNCNGDRNATYKECPKPCVSTCSNPNATPCKDVNQCEPGCQCEPLYILSDEGQCISPSDCPGGNPCGQNKTFVYCNVECPTNFCPENDNRGAIACDPPYPCPSGCSCQQNYKWLDDRCILATDCPPVNCTRQNEVWNSCPPPCFTERCRDLNEPSQECIRYGPDCQPQCVCQDGYRRNDSDICVPIFDCSSDA